MARAEAPRRRESQNLNSLLRGSAPQREIIPVWCGQVKRQQLSNGVIRRIQQCRIAPCGTIWHLTKPFWVPPAPALLG
jgi:hypothetical protein